jgi:hypothetical protein
MQADQGAGLEIQAQVSLTAAVGDLVTELRASRGRHRDPVPLQQVPLACPQFAGGGSGGLDYPDNLKAKTGYYWAVRRLALTGWSAGSVIVYVNGTVAAPGEPVALCPVPAVLTYGRGELLLNPDDRLIVVATGITGVVQLNGRADCFPVRLLASYMGIEDKGY